MKKTLLIIDMLNDFVLKGAPLEVPRAREIIPRIREKINEAYPKDVPVIYICDAHKKDDPEFKVWPVHAVKGTKGAEVVEELKPKDKDYIIYKTTYSGFYKTRLEKLLKRLKIDTLIVTGILTNICVLYTSVDALMRGFNVEIPEGCTAGLNPEDEKFALRQIREILKPRR
ncbi:MAG: cysteine hydrolase [Candidatus Omnitrophica bacterium]|nr:cysteine hydrolase [Candidatus Omnitrophota bacterium]MCM8792916.1 cysteine hydrolase [Candidatus Omnitrophota bacterium]